MHLVDAPQRLVCLPGRVDLGHHRLAGRVVQAAHGRLVHPVEVRRLQVVAARGLHAADLEHVAQHLHARRAKRRPR